MHSTVSKTGGCLINSTRSAPVCSAPGVQAKLKHKGRSARRERRGAEGGSDADYSIQGRIIGIWAMYQRRANSSDTRGGPPVIVSASAASLNSQCRQL